MSETLYRIEELTTSGWNVVEVWDVKLTKDQASKRLEELIAEGYNPNRLRAILDLPQ
jgi:G:T-mismatch repair DNA endonuclease (very short patch repair protein)